jgi:hypothetical protein
MNDPEIVAAMKLADSTVEQMEKDDPNFDIMKMSMFNSSEYLFRIECEYDIGQDGKWFGSFSEAEDWLNDHWENSEETLGKCLTNAWNDGIVNIEKGPKQNY